MSYQTFGNNQNPQQKNERNTTTEKQSQYDPKKSVNKTSNNQSNPSSRNQKDSGKANRG